MHWHCEATGRVLGSADRAGGGGPSARALYQLDRGGDSFHILKKARDEGLCLTVRAAYDRALCDESRSLHEVVSSSKVLGGIQHYLRPGAAKRAGHSAKRARSRYVRRRLRYGSRSIAHDLKGPRWNSGSSMCVKRRHQNPVNAWSGFCSPLVLSNQSTMLCWPLAGVSSIPRHSSACGLACHRLVASSEFSYTA